MDNHYALVITHIMHTARMRLLEYPDVSVLLRQTLTLRSLT